MLFLLARPRSTRLSTFSPLDLLQNVLQGVADDDVLLHDDEKKLFEAWTTHNYERLWAGENSPLKHLDIAVIDDPQRASSPPCLYSFLSDSLELTPLLSRPQ